MRIINTVQDVREWRKRCTETVSFVPTMGSLHAGHQELMAQAGRVATVRVVSIFVNPLQFDSLEDLEKYPRRLEADFEVCKQSRVDVVFCPSTAEVYPEASKIMVTENDLSKRYCGAFRPGHFDGMLTVVLKLLQIVRPHYMMMGEKDFQQLELVRQMAAAFFLDVMICAVPTVRNDAGLALSSRNLRLSHDGLQRAQRFAATLRQSVKNQSAQEAKAAVASVVGRVQYVEDFSGRRLAAVEIDGVRLIDNVEIGL